MTYPTQEELLAAEPTLEWLDEHFLRTDPYAFGPEFRVITKAVARGLRVEPNGIYCIGSGAIGLSLSPHKVQETAWVPSTKARTSIWL